MGLRNDLFHILYPRIPSNAFDIIIEFSVISSVKESDLSVAFVSANHYLIATVKTHNNETGRSVFTVSNLISSSNTFSSLGKIISLFQTKSIRFLDVFNTVSISKENFGFHIQVSRNSIVYLSCIQVTVTWNLYDLRQGNVTTGILLTTTGAEETKNSSSTFSIM